MAKFLVIQTAFTGDVVLATALVEKLHRYFPQAEIDILVRKGNEGLFTDHPFLHEVLVWDKKQRKNRNLIEILGRIRKRQYDKVINLQRFASTGLLTALSDANEKIGFAKNPFSFLFTRKIAHDYAPGKHEVDRNDLLVRDFTDNLPGKPRLYPGEKHFQNTKEYASVPYVCLMPASVWFTKQYPEDHWVDLINRLPGHLTAYLLGGKEDQALCERISKGSEGKSVRVLAGKLDYLSSVALMQGAVMNYTNDSAPLHFASAIDAPVTAIFCSTVPAFGFYPLSEHSHIVETLETLSCRPCSLHGMKACPAQHFKCGRTIKTEQLLQTLP